MNNLLSNACKFTHDGRIDVNLRAVTRNDARYLRFEITDTGEGIGAEHIANLFQRFHQVDSGIARRHGGSGLGLAICREIISLMQGEMGVESDLGIGSTFWFEVPLITAVSPKLEAENAPVSLDARNRTALLVDDHAVNRQMISALITSSGANVVEATNGAEAIALCEHQRFDLILMDIHMPEVDGIAAARHIRQSCAQNRATPIIALTAIANRDLSGRCDETLFADIVTKPIDPGKFALALNLIISE